MKYPSAASPLRKWSHISMKISRRWPKNTVIRTMSGYLTIKKYDMEENSFLLDYPNNEVKEGFLSLVAAGYLVGDGNDSGI